MKLRGYQLPGSSLEPARVFLRDILQHAAEESWILQYIYMSACIHVTKLDNCSSRVCVEVRKHGASSVRSAVSFLRNGSFPPQFSKNEKDVLRRKSENFVVKDQMLFYMNGKGADLQVFKVRSQLNVLFCYIGIVSHWQIIRVCRLSLTNRRYKFWKEAWFRRWCLF